MLLLSVQQLLAYLKELFETNNALSDLWVSGEISNLSRSPAGHVYFTLKDASAQLRCAFFKRQNTGVTLAHGDQIVAHGRVSIYEQRGELNFIVDFVHPQGVGLLNAEFERLKQRLEAEGLFDVARKRPLPAFPRRIGVVTSPTGAVLHDICTIIGRRWPLAQIVVAPTTVQGDTAAAGVVDALASLNGLGNIDVIIVARGGGSLEDLWPFNDERVPRAIYASRVPVISAVGHETDVTLADYAADVRAPTPSAAAEIVVPEQIEIAVRLGAYFTTLEGCARNEIDVRSDRVERLVESIEREQPDFRAGAAEMVALVERAEDRLLRSLERSGASLNARMLQLQSLSPLAVLERGYAVVHNAHGALVSRLGDAPVGSMVSVRVQDGAFDAEVRSHGSG
jgi:exodeoxyribonuclease VII large subunit